MRLIDAIKLYKETAEWESEAKEYFLKISQTPYDEMTETEKINWQRWSAILGERMAFRNDVMDAPVIDAIPVEWIEKWQDEQTDGEYCFELITDMLDDWKNGEYLDISITKENNKCYIIKE